MTRIRSRMRNLKRETESFLIADENNVIRTNYIKEKIDNTEQCRLCEESDETVNDIFCFGVI